MFTSINPATGKIIANYQTLSNAQIATHLQQAHNAFLNWKKLTVSDRAPYFKRLAKLLRDELTQHATLITTEMGKPLSQAKAEIKKCALTCDFYAENAAKFLQDEMITSDAQKSFVTFQPLGIVLAVMPWNFPFWQVIRFAAPALIAGNVGVLKHASNVSGCALALEKLFQAADFPAGVFNTLLMQSDQVNDVIANPLVAAVTLTGSTPAGSSVAQKAGAMLKKTVLELGGSDPYIILADADLVHAAEICAKARLQNTGQSCVAAKRFIVIESIAEKFSQLLREKMQQAKSGDPLLPETTLGPLARLDLRNQLHQQVQKSIKQGARCMLGGEIPEGTGAFYPPTILLDVKPGMPAYQEELFGPVAAIITAKDENEAIKIANDSVFGLGAALFTRDLVKGEKIAAEQLQAGSCFVNVQVASDPRLPFGGIKHSGYGRELSQYGIKEFVNIKTVYIR